MTYGEQQKAIDSALANLRNVANSLSQDSPLLPEFRSLISKLAELSERESIRKDSLASLPATVHFQTIIIDGFPYLIPFEEC